MIFQVLADEQKKLYPDCWKRKRSLSSANQTTPTTQAASQSPIHQHHSSPASSYNHSMPGTPTSLHPSLYHTFSPLTLPAGTVLYC